jgi:hypothetical protein
MGDENKNLFNVHLGSFFHDNQNMLKDRSDYSLKMFLYSKNRSVDPKKSMI